MASPRAPRPAESALARAQRETVLRLVTRRAHGDGAIATALPFVSLLRWTRPSAMRHGILSPSLCLVVQGDKRLLVGRDAYDYGAGWFVMSALEYPVSGQIVRATASAPYLGVRIDFEIRELAEVIAESDFAPARAAGELGPGVLVGAADDRLVGCVLRLLQLLDEPANAAFLAGAIKREIIFRLLRRERGPLIFRSVKPASLGVGRAIDWLRRHFDQPIDIDALARASRMSVSGLRHEFKATTALAPLQFQKQLRLQEARRLLMAGEVDAGTAAFRVGYESPSQFSREYRRMFGAPPLRDVRKLAAPPPAL